MFEAILLTVGAIIALAAVWAAVRPMPAGDPFYI